MDDDMRVIKTEEELKVFNDPYRMKIIKTFQNHDEPLTVKGVADIMGEVPAKIHYHVKKLLAIEILTLDHVEVINGINAKYYKLPKKSFAISIKGDGKTSGLDQLSHVHTIFSNIIDDFKEEFMKSIAKSAERKSEQPSDTGFLTSNVIHLTEEEFKEVTDYLANLTKNHKNNAEGTKQYSFLAGMAKEIEKK